MALRERIEVSNLSEPILIGMKVEDREAAALPLYPASVPLDPRAYMRYHQVEVEPTSLDQSDRTKVSMMQIHKPNVSIHIVFRPMKPETAYQLVWRFDAKPGTREGVQEQKLTVPAVAANATRRSLLQLPSRRRTEHPWGVWRADALVAELGGAGQPTGALLAGRRRARGPRHQRQLPRHRRRRRLQQMPHGRLRPQDPHQGLLLL